MYTRKQKKDTVDYTYRNMISETRSTVIVKFGMQAIYMSKLG